MRIDKIELSWFRGAAENVVIDTGSKNVVVYGLNASGKSSFVDGVEYIMTNGRIKHLRHEYSGSRLEKSVKNTKTPDSEISKVLLYFSNGNNISAEISSDGTFVITSDPPELQSTIQNWDVERHILRQDEVAIFVHSTKGQKYSVLLPLLGLSEIEEIAENLKKIRVNVEKESDIEFKKGYYSKIKNDIFEQFKTLEPNEIFNKISEITKKYIKIEESDSTESLLNKTITKLENIINLAEPEQKRHYILAQISNLKLDEKFNKLISDEEKLKDLADEIIDLHIIILENTKKITEQIEDTNQEIQCPACGQIIRVDELIVHVEKELEYLNEAKKARDRARITRQDFLLSLNSIQSLLTSEPTFLEWLKSPERVEIKKLFDRLQSFKIDDPSIRLREEDILWFGMAIPNILKFILKELEHVPPTTDEIVKDMGFFKLCLNIPGMYKLYNDIKKLEVLINTLKDSEEKVRIEIKRMITEILDNISVNIRNLWSKIHPNEPIEDIKLYTPIRVDRAIDIGLKFYGLDLPSPRLTLSEGYRNSLGLCIFLALANQQDTRDDPIILDDIVSSFDREHRAMLVDILLDDLSERQVLLFTHDREWYTELTHRLPRKTWKFLALKPWKSPEVGIQWSRSPYTFDDARELIDINPEACGNRTRAIMDTYLSLASERLKIRMPYLRGDRNDRRTCIEFFNRLISEGKNRYKIKRNGKWEVFLEPIQKWRQAKSFLIPWGDRASHTGTLTEQEANRLIEVCEEALSYFKCPSCGDYIWIADVSSREYVQCSCGNLRWKYG